MRSATPITEYTNEEWSELLDRLESQARCIEAWPAAEPDPGALRCEFSRHRTLAHLRAAQETWLQAALLFAAKDKATLKLLHPLRLFEAKGYESVPWNEHLAAYLADRAAWLELVKQPGLDRNRGGTVSRKPHTIGSLTSLVVRHEAHHMQTLRNR